MRKMKESGIEWIGKIPQDKKLLKNKYYISYYKGKNPVNINDNGIGIAYIGASDLDDNSHNYKIFSTDTDLLTCNENDILILWDGARAGLIGTNHNGIVSSTICKLLLNDKILFPKFFYWYLKGFENYLTNCVNGTTIPHMSKKYIENINFINWTIEEQKKISAYLDEKCTNIDAIIKGLKKQIELLGDYKKSLITETVTKGLNPDAKMKDSGIEWIGEIPEHWQVKKVKYIAKLSPHCDFSRISDETVIEYLPMEYIKNGYYIHNSKKYSEIPDSLTPFESGDIVFAKVTPCFENGNIAIMNNITSGIGLGSSELFVLRAFDINAMFLFYWLQNTGFVDKATSTMTGMGGLKRVSSKFVVNSDIIIPDIQEQQEIADYLDKKCTKIDKIISVKKQQIKNMEEYKKSLIYEVVTGKKEI